jgi:very-short-patch-repair endonuclease
MHITIQRDQARTLRKAMTSAERKLWQSLRKRRLNGYLFNRQVEIGPFIVDFFNSENDVVVEVDGIGHGDAAEILRDKRRSAYLVAKGYVVFRCWNEDLYHNLDGVLEGLLAMLESRKPRFKKRSNSANPSALRAPPLTS